jgi:hypothetical protein
MITETKQNNDENTCSIFSNNPNIDIQYDFAQFTITDDPEWVFSADGVTSITATALPAL